MPSTHHSECQWLAVTEETLLLHDGLLRVTDLVQLPESVRNGDADLSEMRHVCFDSKDPSQLTKAIFSVCDTDNNEYSKLVEYRMNALCGLWEAQRQIVQDEQDAKISATQEETITILKKQGLLKDQEQASFSTRVSLLLILPLLQSLSNSDKALCGVTAKVLLEALKDCPPFSLAREPEECLKGLENLLCDWIEGKCREESKQSKSEINRNNQEIAASALIALSCARGHLETFIHAVHLLQQCRDMPRLPVSDLLARLLDTEGGAGQPSCFLGTRHMVTWGFEDLITSPAPGTASQHPQLPASSSNSTTAASGGEKDSEKDTECVRSIACDGYYVYTTSSSGYGLCKMGSGFHGTLRGYVYARVQDVGPGRVSWCNGALLYRPHSFDSGANQTHFAQLLHPATLQVIRTIPRAESLPVSEGSMTTLAFCGDGIYLYHVWIPAVASTGHTADKTGKGLCVFADSFQFEGSQLKLTLLRPRITLQRKDDPTSRNLNETLLSRIRPYRASSVAQTLIALTGGESTASKKDDGTAGSVGITSSCGLSLKTLLKTPICCDGNSFVLLSPLLAAPASSSASATRSLFGTSTAGISGLRSLASNLCFSAIDGQFTTRLDLTDAPGCALAAGTPLAKIGVCFDSVNNLLWMCSNEYVDEFSNPGHQAPQHIRHRLGISPIVKHSGSSPAMSSGEIVHHLMQHVASMCIHQLQSDALTSPLASLPLQCSTVQLHLARLTSILETGISNHDNHTIVCSLVVLQLFFKTGAVNNSDSDVKEGLLDHTRSLLWHLLTDYRKKQCVQGGETDCCSVEREAGQVICFALNALYSTVHSRHQLLNYLLTDATEIDNLDHLRDTLLVDLAEQLKVKMDKSPGLACLRLTGELVQRVLNLAVRESVQLVLTATSADRRSLQEMLSEIPRASPCVQYLCALQSFLLREILFCQPHQDPAGSDTQAAAGPEMLDATSSHQPSNKLQSLKAELCNLAVGILNGTSEVAKVLLKQCEVLLTSTMSDADLYSDPEVVVSRVERLVKGTVLGHLLPLLLTALSHSGVQDLTLASQLTPLLTSLLLTTTQTTNLLKTHMDSVIDKELELSSDSDVIGLLGETVSPTKVQQEKQQEERRDGDLLLGMKVPTPWASGRTVETIHPVRDNYKLKETVHIPGARCLYLRFDPRSSSQYDYDKLIVFAGPNTSCRKVSEYGGNILGFGSRSVLGAGWPKDLVKVEGDTVTLSFEMRSGREHNTPDKAMWGFSVTVRAQESAEDVNGGLPLMADLALGLSNLTRSLLSLLYNGPPTSTDERSCQHLLKAKILQRCVWRTEGDTGGDQGASLHTAFTFSKQKIPRIKLSSELVYKLRLQASHPPIKMRPSIKKVLEPEALEERIVSVVVKHLGLCEAVAAISQQQQQPEGDQENSLLSLVLQEVFRRTDSLIRQLQTLADLEQRWKSELEDHKCDSSQAGPPFFNDYHLHEMKQKELSMLCYLKDVTMDPMDKEHAVKMLMSKFECELEGGREEREGLWRTRQVVEAVTSRLDLLLHVSIAPPDVTPSMARSVSTFAANSPLSSAMVRSDTDVLQSSSLARSLSAPSGVDDDSVLEIIKLQRQRQARKKGPSSLLQDLVEADNSEKPTHVVLINQLFSFFGTEPETAISCEKFLKCAEVRWQRGKYRQNAFVHMKSVLRAAAQVGGATHLVSAVTSILRHGPRAEELTCGGMVDQVRDAFAGTMASVVELSSQKPIANCFSITLLCTVPYTRADERCLVTSGLVGLLDQLCCVNSQQYKAHLTSSSPTGDNASLHQHIPLMAWAGFQVLASRCVTWETEDGSGTFDKLEHSGLARQVSTLLTHYLSKATEGASNEAASTEALQDVLGLLNNLSRSRMGKAILSQPACVSKLLSLLLDQRPSPKLVLIIVQLCGVALPMLSESDCQAIQLPSWAHHLLTARWNTTEPLTDTPAVIISLLLAKLGDFLVPGQEVLVSSRSPSQEGCHGPSPGPSPHDPQHSEEGDMQQGRLAVFIHKRTDQMSNEALQPLLSCENRLFRLSSGASVDKVMRMDKEINKHGKAEVLTDDAMSALRKAYKWAQSGLVMSTGCPSLQKEGGDKKKTASEEICRERNSQLARTDPVRPFISSQVANTMAAETISLLHNLLHSPLSSTAHTWAQAAYRVLANVLSGLPFLLNSLEGLGSSSGHYRALMSTAKLANAALCALGGFEETIKPGCHVEVTGEGVDRTVGHVISVVTRTEMATVQLQPHTEDTPTPRYSHVIEVPLTRLRPIRNKMFLSPQPEMWDTVLRAIRDILLPCQVQGPLPNLSLPVVGDGNSLPNQICRVVAEIQTRACTILSLYLQDINFAKKFIETCEPAVDILKSLAKDCSAGKRLSVVSMQCERLRMLYRDCVKPPPPPSEAENRANRQMLWEPNRAYPPVRACLFSQGLSTVTFLGDPSAGSSLPRGVFIYANQAIPQQAPSFYWEIELCSFGDVQGESGPVLSFGFAPAAEKKDGAWTQPVGSVLVHNSGKAVHYTGASLLQWRSVRLDTSLEVGHVAGIGWEQTSQHNNIARGRVFFTLNGHRLPTTLTDVAGALFPVVHIQKKNVRVRGNFGSRVFLYAEGHQHREAAEAASDLTREIRESFSHLPFHTTSSDSESDETPAATEATSNTSELDSRTLPGPSPQAAIKPLARKGYSAEESLVYKLKPSYSYMCSTGPGAWPGAGRGRGSGGPLPQEEEESEGEVEEEGANEDHYALLVRAWEQKVFPVVRRRFRNEAERKDGLEQIRGALQLGMTDIARQTVEFLYEENGGLPRDLHLPTIEDIKEDLSRFTIERVKKGKTVVISTLPKPALPTYAVGSMMKTVGLAGTVLDIDTVNELVQVESYVQSEGVMVRYWYPICSLEKPPKGFRKSSITGGQTLDTSTIAIHREVVYTESVLVRMLLRESLLTLIDHCNSPAMGVSGCSTGLGAGMSASAAGLQELDIANLQLLSNHLLSCATPSGGLVHSALHSATSIRQCLASTSCALTDLLYSRPEHIKRELAIAIARAADQGEDYVIELTTQICQCLETAPELFPVEEYCVREVKVSTDVSFPSAACLVVSCKTDPTVKKEKVPYRSPWARIYTYSGKKVNKSGKPIKQEVICYPQDNNGAGTQAFEPVLIAGDCIHMKLGVSPPPGVTLSVHALPPQFIMAVAYLETLITEQFGCGLQACQKTNIKSKKQLQAHSLEENLTQSSLWSLDNIVLSESILFHAVELVCTYFRKTDIPAIIKEYMFHILAQSLRILHVLNGRRHGLYHKFESMHGAVVLLFKQLQKEMKVLYSSESKTFQHGSTCSGLGIGLGVTDHGRFSSYFHALFEVNLAIAEVLGSEKAFFQSCPLRSFSEDGSVSSKSSSTSKKKKVKPKKERERHQSVPVSSSSGTTSSVDVESSSSSDLLSESSLSSLSPSPSSSSTTPGAEAYQTDEMIWFRRAVNLSNILRVISLGEAFALSSLVDMVGDAARAMFTPTVHQRLIVLSGISPNLDMNKIKEAIHKACDVSGGVDYGDIYVPEVSSKSSTNTQSDKNEQGPSTTTSASQQRGLCQGFAVVNLPSKANVEVVQKSLAKSKPLVEGVSEGSGTGDTAEDFCVSLVNQDLLAEPSANQGLEYFLRYKLVKDKSDRALRDEAVHAVTDIFYSCFFVCQQQGCPSERQETGFICLESDQILFNSCENLLYIFFNSLRPAKKPLSDHVNHVLRQYGSTIVPDKDVSSPSTGSGKNGKGKQGKKSPRSGKEKIVLGKPAERPSSSKDKPTKSKEQTEKLAKETVVGEKKREVKVLTLEGFLLHVTEMLTQDVRHVWQALIACGLDINLRRFRCLDISQAVGMSHQWSLEMDAALVSYVNSLSHNLGLASARIHPHEISLKDSQLASQQLSCLQDCPAESMRLRFALLQLVNNSLETLLLPLVDLRPAHTYSCSTAALLVTSSHFLFYDTKVNFFNRVLNATTQRKADQAAPEITLDPLEGIGNEMKRPSESTVFCQAFRQLQLVPSQQLCVPLASGGDPTYSFLVKLTGEEVHGTSGSFRQFLWQVAREVEAPAIGLLMPCPSASNGVHKGDSVLKPGPMTYQEEQLLQFFGQLLGVTIRADIPLGIGLLSTFWKGLLRQPLDPIEDLKQADIITYNYIKKIEMVETEGELVALCSNTYPQFVYPTLDGSRDRELLPNGTQLNVSWSNRQEYMDCIRGLRVQELICAERSLAVLSGLASIVPLQLLALFTPHDLHMRTCGLPAVNLSFLKAHTMYQVGLMESDRHVQFFWRALEALSQEELARFIKFACNQERIPHTCPCQSGGSDTAHVPPYPMKIAPPDGQGSPDKRYIRVETCMFMIKLPQYSSLEIMSQRLRYAIHCREDPLSG